MPRKKTALFVEKICQLYSMYSVPQFLQTPFPAWFTILPPQEQKSAGVVAMSLTVNTGEVGIQTSFAFLVFSYHI
ncbi:MAG: hypothetical protein HYS60_03040 [Candidatus Wildermuthbacteria bacterium]|nr:hypothetical protein [Candidatus Wildermuthbacteria bacterium]